MADRTQDLTVDPDGAGIPVPASRRRVRCTTAGVVVGVLTLMVVPAMLAAPLADVSPVMMTAGVSAGIGCVALPHLAVARKPWRRHGPDLRYLTARTWAGYRTLDLHALRTVRTWKEVQRGGSTTYIVLTDAAGTRLSFAAPQADRLIRRYAIERPREVPDAHPVRITRLALADLGIRPLPRGFGPIRSLLSVERMCVMLCVPMMISAAIASH
ncbi:hypothetical protein [Peterkaempfera sp. SMS 1(5)a]|uniref:hypothetical protein n=1 Tax=Peterkaempfera podocarpi TaxID=3232308 RepID=UPI00366D3E8F